MTIETNTLVIGWNRPTIGREGVAAELFANTQGYLEKQVKANKLTSFEPVFLEAHGGDFNGFWLVKGTHQQIDQLRREDEFVDIVMRALHCVDGFGVNGAYSGQQLIGEMMTRWTKQIPR
jgi:hypothetical protein